VPHTHPGQTFDDPAAQSPAADHGDRRAQEAQLPIPAHRAEVAGVARREDVRLQRRHLYLPHRQPELPGQGVRIGQGQQAQLAGRPGHLLQSHCQVHRSSVMRELESGSQ
jgi:hypothetical protein